METIPNPPIIVSPAFGPVPVSVEASAGCAGKPFNKSTITRILFSLQEPAYIEKPSLSAVILAGASSLAYYVSILFGVGLAFYFLYLITEYLAPNAAIRWGRDLKRGAKKMRSHGEGSTVGYNNCNENSHIHRLEA